MPRVKEPSIPSPPLLTRARLARGLHWKGKYPPIPWRQLALITAILLIYGLVDKIDQLVEENLVLSQALEIEGARAQVLRDCERGAVGYYYPDGRAYECSKKL